MKKQLNIMLVIAFLFIEPVGAEFYEYTDAQGHLHFTDDLSDVPEDQRSKVTASREIPLEKTGVNYMDELTGDPEKQESAAINKEGKLQAEAKKLDDEQSALDQIYENLKEEQQDLGDPPPASAKLQDKRAYQARIEKLNRRIAEYEEQRNQFERKVADYITNGLHNRQ